MKLTLTPYEAGDLIPVGTLQTFETEMIPYPDHRRRTIRVWLPEDYDGVKRFPVVYLHDGQGVFQTGDGKFKLNPDRALAALRAEAGHDRGVGKSEVPAGETPRRALPGGRLPKLAKKLPASARRP